MFARRLRTELLIESEPSLAHEIAQAIASKRKIIVEQSPKQVLVMNKVRESAKNTLFYLGEAVATEAIVYLDQIRGLGIVLGTKDELALDLAIIDAAYAHPDVCTEMQAFDVLLQEAKQKFDTKRREQQKMYQASKVQFETMAEEL